MTLTLQVAFIVTTVATMWQHVSAIEHAFSKQFVSGAPVVGPSHKIQVADEEGKTTYDFVAHPQYRNAYQVADPHSGDFHMHEEHRDGEAVSGSYSVRDADGRLRTVHYVADEGGYRAEVTYSREASPAAPAHERAPVTTSPAPPPQRQQRARAQPVQAPVDFLAGNQVHGQSQIHHFSPAHNNPLVQGHGQGHSHASLEGHGHSLSHAQVHERPRPAPAHAALHSPLDAQRPLHTAAHHAQHLKQHRAQLNRHHAEVQHHAQGLAHAQQLAEAQGLAH